MSGVPDVLIGSLAEAQHFLLSDEHCSAIRCLVSIGDPGERVPAGYARVRRRLRLEMCDIVEDDEGRAPTYGHIERIVAFADVILKEGGTALFHCQAGISRSTAAAFTVLCQALGAGREHEALDRVLRIRPIAYPNARIVRIADELLGRRGAMARALVERGLSWAE